MEGIAQIIRDVDFTVVAAVVDKCRLGHQLARTSDVYELVLAACVERLQTFLASPGNGDLTTHIVIESRGSGKGGDGELDYAFQRIQARNTDGNKNPGLEIKFADKKTNATGLQIADLTARPIGLHCIRPEQPNRAWDLVVPNILTSPDGDMEGAGLINLP